MFGAKGLRLRRVSEVLLVGDRERRSKREVRFTSGSVWSNLERFETFRSSSAISRSYRDILTDKCLWWWLVARLWAITFLGSLIMRSPSAPRHEELRVAGYSSVLLHTKVIVKVLPVY